MKEKVFFGLFALLILMASASGMVDQASNAGPSVDIRPRMEGNRYRGATAAGVIDVPPIVLWNLLTDYESDPKYFPNTSESRILERDGSRIVVYKKMKFYFFRFKVVIKYSEEREKYRLLWSQIQGPFTVNNGTWTLEPYEGNRTLATYSIELDHPLMTRWLAERLLSKNIPDMFRIIGQRAKSL